MKYKIISVGLLIGGLILISISFGSLLVNASTRDQYLLDSQTGTGYNIYYSKIVDGEHNYSIVVSASQEYYDEDSRVDADVVIYVDEISVVDTQLQDVDILYEDDYNSLASDSVAYNFETASSANITIAGSFYQGDEWEIRIYQDLPSNLDTQLTMAMILLVAGFVVLLLGLGLMVKARRS